MACPLLLSMKYSLLLFICGLFISCMSNPSNAVPEAEAQERPQRATTMIEWLTGTTHDFGVYSERETKTCEFVFRNIGKIPFAINSVLTSCGCTSADYMKRPVLPGKTDTIRVSYHGNGFLPGYFHQRCCIFANIDESPVCLEIKGIFDHVE